MKIVSLLPSATEIVYALGLGDQLVAVTHECDFPDAARQKPMIMRSILPSGLPSGDIHAAVSSQIADSHSLYAIDRDLLRSLQPDMILTQQLCDVCAVSYNDVLNAVRSLPPPGPRVVNLEPTTLDDVLGNIETVGLVAGQEEAAARVCRSLRQRIEAVRVRAAQAIHCPRVVLLEWIDPLFCGGHWDPELVEIAGGFDGVGRKHQPSVQVTWETVRDFAPEVVVVAQCGFSVARSRQDLPILERLPGYADLPAVQNGRVFVVNGSDYFSRPGPRLVDSLELLASLIHPELFADPNGLNAK